MRSVALLKLGLLIAAMTALDCYILWRCNRWLLEQYADITMRIRWPF